MKKIILIVLPVMAVIVLVASGFAFGYNIGQEQPKTLVVRGVSGVDAPPGVEGNADFSPFWEAWQVVNDSYLKNNDIPNQARVEGAINGLVSSLDDPYSSYFNKIENEKFESEVNGDFGGIGAEIGYRKNRLVIIAPLKDSPAMKANLKPDDWILQINATSSDGLTVDQAVTMIRGPKGTKVKLTILRDGWDKPKEITITRSTIVVPTVDFEMKGDIAYIQLHSFNSHAEELFRNAANEAIQKNARGMILDMRNDPGGYLEVAVDLAGLFLPRNTLIVSEVYRNGTKDDLTSGGDESLKNMPVVVLMNKGSASASEILAGTLRDNRGTKLIGEQSFGKGTVQDLKNLRNGAKLKLTVARWVLPSGIVFENGGLKPDIEVKLTDKDAEAKKDPQLDRALEEVRKLIK